MATVDIGVDIGQRIDPTAIAVTEVERRNLSATQTEVHYVCRHLERLPLGTSYPDVVKRLTELVVKLKERARQPVHVGNVTIIPSDDNPSAPLTARMYVDATGVGQPVVDLLKAAGVTVTPVYFTHGDRRTQEGGHITLGKAWMVSKLQALLQTGRLHLPNTAEARVLAQELQDYEIRVDIDANDKYGAFRVGAHDDLVTALGLTVQSRESAFGAI